MTQGSDEDEPNGGNLDAGWDDLLGDGPETSGGPTAPAAPSAPASGASPPLEAPELDALGLGEPGGEDPTPVRAEPAQAVESEGGEERAPASDEDTLPPDDDGPARGALGDGAEGPEDEQGPDAEGDGGTQVQAMASAQPERSHEARAPEESGDEEADAQAGDERVVESDDPDDTQKAPKLEERAADSTSDGQGLPDEDVRDNELRGSAEHAAVAGAFEAVRHDGPEPPPPRTLEDDLDADGGPEVHAAHERTAPSPAADRGETASEEAWDEDGGEDESGESDREEDAKGAIGGESEEAERRNARMTRDSARDARVTRPEPALELAEDDAGGMGLVLIAGIAVLAVTMFFALRPGAGIEADHPSTQAEQAETGPRGEHVGRETAAVRRPQGLEGDGDEGPTLGAGVEAEPHPMPAIQPAGGAAAGGEETGGEETGGEETGSEETGGGETGDGEAGGEETGDEAGGDEATVEPEPSGALAPGGDPRAVPPGTSAKAERAFRRIPALAGDGPPLGAIGDTGIHVDGAELGSDYIKGECAGVSSAFSASAQDEEGSRVKVSLCLRLVHDKTLRERVTVEWIKDGEKKRRTKLDVPDKHAHKTRVYLGLRPDYVGDWEVRVVSEDKKVLVQRTFSVSR